MKRFILGIFAGVSFFTILGFQSTGTEPPDFPKCRADQVHIGDFEGFLRRDKEPRSHQENFSTSQGGTLVLDGFVKEGHPEKGCPGDKSCDQRQNHEDVVFEIDGLHLGTYEDSQHDGNENAWFAFGSMKFSAGQGAHDLVFRHTLHGDTPESVDYRYSVCLVPDAEPTRIPPTDVPPTSKPKPTDTPVPPIVVVVTNTPIPLTPILASVPTETPTSMVQVAACPMCCCSYGERESIVVDVSSDVPDYSEVILEFKLLAFILLGILGANLLLKTYGTFRKD